ncbi:S-adenosyl-L-methionine-dependent methyltransferase [Delitschia confertaspora ATCC 74209]|uniref:S-adenosyl-L-methionine-dependent methyltransferase n=1 Tax=Delitschia confertaspora ATCC 74209 TaxID=1513339 RepID=A0A9P4N324_9PLEO|nr:S-adenosyl-L-methionine-dependent methyltransferase [Delitschia confertaspora ATCC 74209]
MSTNSSENNRAHPIPQSQTLDVYETASNSGDSDSAYGDLASETASLSSSILAGHYENGRRYHAYQSGKYMFPDDEQEQDRLDIKYASLNLVMGGKVFWAPVKSPSFILDVGTGTGIWAIDCAEEWPEATVVATDLSPIQPTWVPPNVQFQIDDAEQPWTWPENHFDLVHWRTMTGAIRDWDTLYQQAFRHTKPGGYIEVQEMDYMAVIQTESSKEPGTSFLHWCALQNSAALRANISLRTSPQQIKSHMEKAGFVDVQTVEFKLPIGPWAKMKRLREAGLLQLSAMLEGIEGLSLRLMKNYGDGGWTVEELHVLLAKVRSELKSGKVHAYWPLMVVYAKKPELPQAPDDTPQDA